MAELIQDGKASRIATEQYVNDRLAGFSGGANGSKIDDSNITNMPEIQPSQPLSKYSLDEQVVGTWIDGKPIYQKTYSTNISSIHAGGSYVFGFMSQILPGATSLISSEVCSPTIGTLNYAFMIDGNKIIRICSYLTNGMIQNAYITFRYLK